MAHSRLVKNVMKHFYESEAETQHNIFAPADYMLIIKQLLWLSEFDPLKQ